MFHQLNVDALVRGTRGDTKAVWPTFAFGFHAAHRNTPGMSPNQT